MVSRGWRSARILRECGDVMKRIFLIFLLSSGWLAAGSPERARMLTRRFDLAYAQWVNDVRNAPNDDAQNAALARKPDEEEAGRAVWQEIRDDLNQTWVLEPAAWLLQETPVFVSAVPKSRLGGESLQSPAALIREAVRDHHLKSAKLGPYCIALTNVEDPKAMSLLEMVEKVNPSQAVKGAAALGQAILHRRLGDGKLFMAKRQEKLRTAIKSPDLTVGKTTTLAILKDELFRMNRLNLGTKAPDFRGMEVKLEKSQLSDYEGQVTVLFFWNSLMPAHDEALALMRKYEEEFTNEGIKVLGVNIDNPITLRRQIREGTVTWTSFSDPAQKISNLYRIERFPFVFVLDREHKIRFKGEPGTFVKITALDLARQQPATGE